MDILTLVNEKGGVGKTTVALHIAAGMAIRGLNVLLIDADPQANATILLEQKEYGGLYRLLIQEEGWAGLYNSPSKRNWAGDFARNCGELQLIPGNVETRGIPQMTDDTNILVDRLAEIEHLYDVAVIDTSPTPSMLHAMIYNASTHVLIPTICDRLSVTGTGKSRTRIHAASKSRKAEGRDPIQCIGVQPTMHTNTNAHNFGLSTLQKHFGEAGVWKPLRQLTVVRDAAYDFKTLFAYAPEHEATYEMWEVVDRVMEHLTIPVAV